MGQLVLLLKGKYEKMVVTSNGKWLEYKIPIEELIGIDDRGWEGGSGSRLWSLAALVGRVSATIMRTVP